MTATGRQSDGSRTLDAVELALIDEVKAHAEDTRALINRVQRHVNERLEQPLPEGHAPHSQVTHPGRWVAMAQSDLQVGFMKLVRAVAQPSTF